MYKIFFDKNAENFLKKLKRREQEGIINKIKKLEEDPKIGKPLSGNLAGLWRLRYDKIRIIYRIFEDKLIISIIDIGHRKDIYDK